MKIQIKSIFRAAGQSFGGAIYAVAVLLIASGAQAQNLFVVDSDAGCIYEFTPGGVQSTFATGYVLSLMDWPLTARATCLWRIKAAATSMNSRRAECKAPLPPGWIPLRTGL